MHIQKLCNANVRTQNLRYIRERQGRYILLIFLIFMHETIQIAQINNFLLS